MLQPNKLGRAWHCARIFWRNPRRVRLRFYSSSPSHYSDFGQAGDQGRGSNSRFVFVFSGGILLSTKHAQVLHQVPEPRKRRSCVHACQLTGRTVPVAPQTRPSDSVSPHGDSFPRPAAVWGAAAPGPGPAFPVSARAAASFTLHRKLRAWPPVGGGGGGAEVGCPTPPPWDRRAAPRPPSSPRTPRSSSRLLRRGLPRCSRGPGTSAAEPAPDSPPPAQPRAPRPRRGSFLFPRAPALPGSQRCARNWICGGGDATLPHPRAGSRTWLGAQPAEPGGGGCAGAGRREESQSGAPSLIMGRPTETSHGSGVWCRGAPKDEWEMGTRGAERLLVDGADGGPV